MADTEFIVRNNYFSPLINCERRLRIMENHVKGHLLQNHRTVSHEYKGPICQLSVAIDVSHQFEFPCICTLSFNFNI